MNYKNIIKAPKALVRFVFSSEYKRARFALAEDAQKASRNLWYLFTLELASKWVPAAQMLHLLSDKVPVVTTPISGWVVSMTLAVSVVLRGCAFVLQKGEKDELEPN